MAVSGVAAIAIMCGAAWAIAQKKPQRHHICYCQVLFYTPDGRLAAVTGPCMYRTNTPVSV